MMPWYFAGRARRAALRILDDTCLGLALASHSQDDGSLLVVHIDEDTFAVLSTGEKQLWHLLGALGGHDAVNLYQLVNAVDDTTAVAVALAISELCGLHVAELAGGVAVAP